MSNLKLNWINEDIKSPRKGNLAKRILIVAIALLLICSLMATAFAIKNVRVINWRGNWVTIAKTVQELRRVQSSIMDFYRLIQYYYNDLRAYYERLNNSKGRILLSKEEREALKGRLKYYKATLEAVYQRTLNEIYSGYEKIYPRDHHGGENVKAKIAFNPYAPKLKQGGISTSQTLTGRSDLGNTATQVAYKLEKNQKFLQSYFESIPTPPSALSIEEALKRAEKEKSEKPIREEASKGIRAMNLFYGQKEPFDLQQQLNNASGPMKGVILKRATKVAAEQQYLVQMFQKTQDNLAFAVMTQKTLEKIDLTEIDNGTYTYTEAIKDLLRIQYQNALVQSRLLQELSQLNNLLLLEVSWKMQERR